MSEAQDRADVIDVVARYMSYADRRRWADMVPLFDETVAYDYSSLRPGEAPSTSPTAELIERWRVRHEALPAHQHHLGTMIADVTADSATCSASGIAVHRRRAADGPGLVLWQAGINYDWRLRRVDGRWRISAVVATRLWERVEPTAG